MSDWKSEVQRRRAILLNYLLLTGAAVGFIAMVMIYVGGLSEKGPNPFQRSDLWPYLIGWLIVSIAWRWRALGYRVRAGVLLVLSYLMGYSLISVSGVGGLLGGGRIWLVLLPALTFVLLGERAGFVAAGLSVLTYVVFAIINLAGADLSDLGDAGYWLSEAGDFLLGVVGLVLILRSFNHGWVDALSQASAANQQLQAQTQTLEETTKQLRATAAVAHACSSILDPEVLAVEVVNRIQHEFGGLDVYHAGLFLLDEDDAGTDRRFATLRAATGPLGRQLLEQDYRLSLDGKSAISQCINEQQPVVISGEEEEALVADSPLQRARSEAALPLYSRERILGALSVLSTQEDVFDEGIVAVLAAMADQVAVALDNARLFTQTGTALREVQAAQRRYLTEAWKEFLNIRPETRFEYTQPGVALDDGGGDLLRDARRAAMLHERSVAIDSTPSDSEAESSQTVLAVPLKLRGQVIGTLSLHETRRRRPWTSEEIAMAETIAEQVALTVENLRLMDEAQRRATRERLVGDVTARVRETLDLDTVLQSAAREISEALDLYDVTIHLGVDVD
jgi:GAF domain-containing protein